MESPSVDLAMNPNLNLDETSETPESTKDDNNTDVTKTESPKILKPVLGKEKAKQRLMAFANKFNAVPKVKKFKYKVDKIKSKLIYPFK